MEWRAAAGGVSGSLQDQESTDYEPIHRVSMNMPLQVGSSVVRSEKQCTKSK